MLLEVENGQVLSASPQRSHPVSRGTLCVKGWNGHQIIHHPSRLKKPLIKVNGRFKEATWEQALQLVARRFKSLIRRRGSSSIGVVGSLKCSNEENYLLARFARSVLGTPHLDSALRFYMAPSMRVLHEQSGYAVATCSLADIEKADVLLIIGADVKAQVARIGSLVLQAAKQGRKVLLIDPHEQDFSRFFANQLRPHPGTDLALLNAMQHIILEKGWHDTQRKGISRLLGDGLSRFTPEYGESVTGVPADQIRRAAETFATTGRGVILFGSGLTQQANATANIRAVWNLALLTGNIGNEGSGILPLLYTNNMQGAMDFGLAAEFLPGHGLVRDKACRAQWEKRWGGKLSREEGFTLPEMLTHAGDSIRSLYIVGENLAWSAPDTLQATTALEKLDFLVVQDLFMTATAERADVVLPACSFAEKEGTYTSIERRVQKINQAIPPLGQSQSDADILISLARSMGVRWKYDEVASILNEIGDTIPCYGQISAPALEAGGVIWPSHENGEESDLYRRLLGERRGAFADITLGQPDAEEPDEEYPYTLITGRPAFHRMTGTLISHSFTLDKEDPVAIVEINTDDAKALKLRSGWVVKVRTRRGEVRRTVSVTRAVPPKVLFMPIHHKDGLTQSLMNAAVEKESGIPQMKMCPAKLEMV